MNKLYAFLSVYLIHCSCFGLVRVFFFFMFRMIDVTFIVFFNTNVSEKLWNAKLYNPDLEIRKKSE